MIELLTHDITRNQRHEDFGPSAQLICGEGVHYGLSIISIHEGSSQLNNLPGGVEKFSPLLGQRNRGSEGRQNSRDNLIIHVG